MVRAGRLAQLVEHRLYTPVVTGSSPVPPTIVIADWRLQIDDCQIVDCGLTIDGLRIDDWARQSAIVNPSIVNRQSTINQSSFCNRQSTMFQRGAL
jgi:hypothetical protein